MKFPYFTSNFNHFELGIFGEKKEFIYHLSGYGSLNNEALMGLIGEGAERFSFVSQYKLINREIYSYEELMKASQSREFLNWEYINIFDIDVFRLSTTNKIS